jgi:hypothetical protein
MIENSDAALAVDLIRRVLTIGVGLTPLDYITSLDEDSMRSLERYFSSLNEGEYLYFLRTFAEIDSRMYINLIPLFRELYDMRYTTKRGSVALVPLRDFVISMKEAVWRPHVEIFFPGSGDVLNQISSVLVSKREVLIAWLDEYITKHDLMSIINREEYTSVREATRFLTPLNRCLLIERLATKVLPRQVGGIVLALYDISKESPDYKGLLYYIVDAMNRGALPLRDFFISDKHTIEVKPHAQVILWQPKALDSDLN